MTKTKNTKFYSGTSGLALTLPKSKFPGEFQGKTRLHYYSSLFNSLEVNSSFYKPPMAVTVRKWSEAVPGNFRFTFKLWKKITHNKGLDFIPGDVDNFFEIINNIGNKKGCLLVQLPPSLTISHEKQLINLLHSIRRADPGQLWNTAIEFRNNSWYTKDIYDMLSQFNVSLVMHDLPASATPLINVETDTLYVRFHGPGGGYRGSYTNELLREYALRIKQWIKDGKTVYVYFNNTMGGAVDNLTALNNFF